LVTRTPARTESTGASSKGVELSFGDVDQDADSN
jgi:hypothetical protein